MRGGLAAHGGRDESVAAIQRRHGRHVCRRGKRQFRRLRQEIIENAPGAIPQVLASPTNDKDLAGTRRGDIQEPIFLGLQIGKFCDLVVRPIRMLPK